MTETHAASSIEPRMDTRDGFWLVGLVSTGPYADAHERMTALWRTIDDRQGELALDSEPDEWVSLCHGRETEFSCYIGVAMPVVPTNVPDGMVAVEVLPHEYAVSPVRGTQDDVNAVYTQLPAWIEGQGRVWDRAALWLEVYPVPYRDDQTEMHFEVWLPLVDEREE